MSVSFFGIPDAGIVHPRIKCLIVDDLAENLLALSGLLRNEDIELFQARSGPEALDLLLQHDMALAILDVQMPQMDGFELAELIRGSERTRHIPLIFVTAGSHDKRRTFKGYEAGAVDFLYKPIEPHVLLSKAGVFFQLSRQKQQLERELQQRTQSLQLSEMLMAVLSHDLRNPLHSMLMAAHTIQCVTHDELIRHCTQQIATSGERMTRLIADILDLTRTRLGNGIELTREEGDITNLIAEIADEHRRMKTCSAINFSNAGDGAGQWDMQRMAQVFSNLLGNALEHGEPGKPIDIIFDGTNFALVTISIINAGEIPAHTLPHLFDPFRGSYSSKNPTSGLGLGLYIAAQIIEAHGGKITAESHDKKVTFSLSIPRITVETR